MVDENTPRLPGPPRRLRRPDSLNTENSALAEAKEAVAQRAQDAGHRVVRDEDGTPTFIVENTDAQPLPEPVEPPAGTINGEPVTEAQIQQWADEAEAGYHLGDEPKTVDADVDPVERLVEREEVNTDPTVAVPAESSKSSPFNTPVTGSTPAGVPPLTNDPAVAEVPAPATPSFEEVIKTEETVGEEAPVVQGKKSPSRGFLVTLVVLAVALIVAGGAYLALQAAPGLFGAATPPGAVSAPPAPSSDATPAETTPAETSAPAETKEETDKPIRTVEGAEPELLQIAPTADTEQDAAWDALFPQLEVSTIQVDEGRWLAAETCRRLSEGEDADTLTTWLAGLAADTAEVGKVAEAGVATYCTDQTPALLSAFETVGMI